MHTMAYFVQTSGSNLCKGLLFDEHGRQRTFVRYARDDRLKIIADIAGLLNYRLLQLWAVAMGRKYV